MELPPQFPEPIVGRFVVEHQVGEGATGRVFRAFDLKTRRPVALKIFHADNQQSAQHTAVHGAQSARAEQALLENIRDSSVVEIVDSGIVESLDRAYLAMQWVEGGELWRRHQNAPFSVREIIALGILLSRGLGKLHREGIVHSDIKPSNIMLRGRQPDDTLVPELEVEPVLIDFGAASRKPTGPFIGTPAYMSPEQARGDSNVNHRTDLYSLGATMFELLNGRPPHQGASPLATLARLATAPAPRLSTFRTDLPPRLDDAVDALLQTDPNNRPAHATEVEELLNQCLEESGPEYWPNPEASSRLGNGSKRLVTTLVALRLPGTQAQDDALIALRTSGAEAVPLGSEAVVAHLGVSRATGREARAAIELGLMLSHSGASVGIASGRTRLEGARGGKARPVGEVVDRAATLAHDSASGQVLADASTSELGRGRFEFRRRVDGSAIVGEMLRGQLREQSGGAPFVGRDAELAQILSAYDRAHADKRSMVLSVSGPPGIGKSRLQRESVARLSTKAQAPRIIVQRSDAYGSRQILGAAADILRNLVDLPRGASAEQIESAIVERLGPETMSELTGENRRLLAELLGGPTHPEQFDPAGSRDALWLAMTDLVTRVLSNESIVLVTEDLQWADTESVAWLDHLLGRSSRQPLFLLACVRPSFWKEDEDRYKNRDHLRIDLRPISHQAVRIIAETVLGERATPKALDDISTQAGGSPLFAEELARLAATGKGAERAPTIEAAIQASLDALEPSALDALGKLSVLGQSCWDSALTHFSADHDKDVMRTLITHDVLVEQDESRFVGTKEYVFKHALVRDVAYASLEDAHKRQLHAMAGHWLAQMGEDAATVAGHLDLGGEHHVAATYWERAASRALSANALRDALTMAERALDFSETNTDSFRRASYLDEAHSRLDPRAADRETAIGALERSAYDEPSRVRAKGARARFDDARGTGIDVSQRLAEVRDAAAQLDLPDEVARSSATLATRAAFAGDTATAENEAQRLLDLSLHRVHGARVDGYQILAIIRQAEGAVSASLDARKSAAQAARDAGLREREAMLTTNLGFALSTIGARKEARDALERGLLLAEHIGSPGATRHAQMNLLGWAGLYGSDRLLDTYLSETRAEADAAATGYWTSPDRSNLGILYYRGVELLRSNTESARKRALSLLKLSVESYRQLGHHDVLPVALGMWAEAERLCHNTELAAQIGEEAAQLILQGAPSLLNESPVFLTLYKAKLELGDEEGAADALIASIHPLLRRLKGLVGSAYAGTFLMQLPQNAELVSAVDAAGLLPESIHRILTSTS